MTFSELREGLFARGRFGVRPGLETTRQILDRLDHPERQFPVVHIAGTNGKGSTAAFLASILKEGGYRTGLFTSPHLIRYTERFRINGREITEEALVPLAERVLAVAPVEATFFEVTTALAFLFFAQERVDLAVMEVGMGGRLDATNAVTGILSVITPVNLDHCRYLGETIREIAGEKAGVITGNGPVVCSTQDGEALSVIAARCATSGAPLFRCGREFRAEWRQDGLLAYHGLKSSVTVLTPGIPGDYQRDNAACALATAELLTERGFPLELSSLSRGVTAASWPGRMELFPGPPRLLLDGAHNPAGVAALLASLEKIRRERLFLITGVMADKDREGVLGPLLSLADEVITVSIGLPQATPAAELVAFCSARGTQAIAAGSVAQGLAAASNRAGHDDLILVTGSLYLVGEARGVLLGQSSHPFQG
jgi:dihydrofolate synthase/folylpolyglutamate synthase